MYIQCTCDCLGCAVLLCLVVCLTLLASFFLPSHLSLKHLLVLAKIHCSALDLCICLDLSHVYTRMYQEYWLRAFLCNLLKIVCTHNCLLLFLTLIRHVYMKLDEIHNSTV